MYQIWLLLLYTLSYVTVKFNWPRALISMACGKRHTEEGRDCEEVRHTIMEQYLIFGMSRVIISQNMRGAFLVGNCGYHIMITKPHSAFRSVGSKKKKLSHCASCCSEGPALPLLIQKVGHTFHKACCITFLYWWACGRI